MSNMYVQNKNVLNVHCLPRRHVCFDVLVQALPPQIFIKYGSSLRLPLLRDAYSIMCVEYLN